MPIHEYVCADCGAKFELLRPFSEANEKALCPQGHKNTQRAVSACASFSRNESGESVPVSGTGSACGSCHASSCSTCGL